MTQSWLIFIWYLYVLVISSTFLFSSSSYQNFFFFGVWGFFFPGGGGNLSVSDVLRLIAIVPLHVCVDFRMSVHAFWVNRHA